MRSIPSEQQVLLQQCDYDIIPTVTDTKSWRPSFAPSNSFSSTGDDDDDDESITSTAAAPVVPKSVRFADEPIICHDTAIGTSCGSSSSGKFHPLAPEERAKIWWGKEELKKNQLRAVSEVAKIASKKPDGEEFENSLEEIYDTAQNVAVAVPRYEELAVLLGNERFVAEQTECIADWGCRDRNGRGLESWLSDKHSAVKQKDIQRARKVVVEMGGSRNQRHEEDIKLAYQNVSRSWVILARLMAEADAMAASKYQAERSGEESAATRSAASRKAPPKRSSSGIGKLARSLLRKTSSFRQ